LGSTNPRYSEILEIIVPSFYAILEVGTPEHCQLKLVADWFVNSLVGRLWKILSSPVLKQQQKSFQNIFVYLMIPESNKSFGDFAIWVHKVVFPWIFPNFSN
jgi:hypothetical protein